MVDMPRNARSFFFKLIFSVNDQIASSHNWAGNFKVFIGYMVCVFMVFGDKLH